MSAPTSTEGPSTSSSSTNPIGGALCVLAGTFLLTCHDAISKFMTTEYSVGEVMVYRSAAPLVLLSLILLHSGGPRALLPRSPRGNLTRGILAALTSFLVVSAYARMPLADALTIIFASPIFVTALSAPLLGENVSWRRWLAVMAGFLGVVVMVNPTGDVIRLGAIIAVGASLAAAFRDVLTRRLGTADSTTSIMFYSTLCTALFGLPFMGLGGASLPSIEDWGLFLVAGFFVTSAHWLLIKAYQIAEASLVAPLRYVAIVYAVIIGFLVFDEQPGIAQFLGASIVIFAGVYIVRPERKHLG